MKLSVSCACNNKGILGSGVFCGSALLVMSCNSGRIVGGRCSLLSPCRGYIWRIKIQLSQSRENLKVDTLTPGGGMRVTGAPTIVSCCVAVPTSCESVARQ
jgi:hypothetical protein